MLGMCRTLRPTVQMWTMCVHPGVGSRSPLRQSIHCGVAPIKNKIVLHAGYDIPVVYELIAKGADGPPESGNAAQVVSEPI